MAQQPEAKRQKLNSAHLARISLIVTENNPLDKAPESTRVALTHIREVLADTALKIQNIFDGEISQRGVEYDGGQVSQLFADILAASRSAQNALLIPHQSSSDVKPAPPYHN